MIWFMLTKIPRAPILGLAFLAILPVNVSAKAPTVCAPSPTAQSDALKALAGVFAALRADDEAGFESQTTADFYAYDVGKRLTAAELLGLVKSAHAAGKKYEWTVTEPQMHVLCDWAWVTYVNMGSLEDISGRQELKWLESAILHYDNAHWRVQFLHSTRAQTP